MKLDKQEISALASYVHEQIREKNHVELSTREEQALDKFLKEKDDINDEILKLTTKVQNMVQSFKEKYGIKGYYSLYSTSGREEFEKVIKQSKVKKLPTLETIRTQIILKNLLADKEEIEKFIKELVAKY